MHHGCLPHHKDVVMEPWATKSVEGNWKEEDPCCPEQSTHLLHQLATSFTGSIHVASDYSRTKGMFKKLISNWVNNASQYVFYGCI
jgi:hypothetical protein